MVLMMIFNHIVQNILSSDCNNQFDQKKNQSIFSVLFSTSESDGGGGMDGGDVIIVNDEVFDWGVGCRGIIAGNVFDLCSDIMILIWLLLFQEY